MFPSDDVSDLRDVVEAINRLCDTMTTSRDQSPNMKDSEDQTLTMVAEPNLCGAFDTCKTEIVNYTENMDISKEIVNKEEIFVKDQLIIEPKQLLNEEEATEDLPLFDEKEYSKNATKLLNETENATITEHSYREQEHAKPERSISEEEYKKELGRPLSEEEFVTDYERLLSEEEHVTEPDRPPSELYYTASSEVSVMSDGDVPERIHDTDDAVFASDLLLTKEETKECVMAGHVAAMRERFESMTRTSTPVPHDLTRSISPSLDALRNVTPSPDCLDG